MEESWQSRYTSESGGQAIVIRERSAANRLRRRCRRICSIGSASEFTRQQLIRRGRGRLAAIHVSINIGDNESKSRVPDARGTALEQLAAVRLMQLAPERRQHEWDIVLATAFEHLEGSSRTTDELLAYVLARRLAGSGPATGDACRSIGVGQRKVR